MGFYKQITSRTDADVSRNVLLVLSRQAKPSPLATSAGKSPVSREAREVLVLYRKARVSKLHTRARCVCALSIQRLALNR